VAVEDASSSESGGVFVGSFGYGTLTQITAVETAEAMAACGEVDVAIGAL
jgi:hypothetical protein